MAATAIRRKATRRGASRKPKSKLRRPSKADVRLLKGDIYPRELLEISFDPDIDSKKPMSV